VKIMIAELALAVGLLLSGYALAMGYK